LQRQAAGRPSADESKAEIRSFHAAMQLADPRVIQLIPEKDTPWTSNAITIWAQPHPAAADQYSRPAADRGPWGPHEFMLIWTTFGYADDTPEMEQHRLRQNKHLRPRRLPRDRRQRGAQVRAGRSSPLRPALPASRRSAATMKARTPSSPIAPSDRCTVHYRESMGF